MGKNDSDLLAQCKLLATEARDPQQLEWYKWQCTPARLREASTSIRAVLNSPYLGYMNNPKTAAPALDVLGLVTPLRLVDSPKEGEDKPKANFQMISAYMSGIKVTEVLH